MSASGEARATAPFGGSAMGSRQVWILVMLVLVAALAWLIFSV